jgi:hypothetical protein
MAFHPVEPSSDAKATAISVAWQIALHTHVRVPNAADGSEAEAKGRAALVGELAKLILEGANSAGQIAGFEPNRVVR